MGSEDSNAIISDSNTVPAVLGAMRRHPDDNTVQDAAVQCIRLLAGVGTDETCADLLSLGAHDLLLEVLRSGPAARVSNCRAAMRCLGLIAPPAAARAIVSNIKQEILSDSAMSHDNSVVVSAPAAAHGAPSPPTPSPPKPVLSSRETRKPAHVVCKFM